MEQHPVMALPNAGGRNRSARREAPPVRRGLRTVRPAGSHDRLPLVREPACAAFLARQAGGCPPHDRLALCKAFIAKAVWDYATTRELIDAIRHRPALRRLCGWESLGEVPSEATCSRAFDVFARDGRPQQIHEALIKTHSGDKLAGHVSRDATAIRAREKAEAKPKAAPKLKRSKRGRRHKDEPPAPPPDPTRLQQQLERDFQANLAELGIPFTLVTRLLNMQR